MFQIEVEEMTDKVYANQFLFSRFKNDDSF